MTIAVNPANLIISVQEAARFWSIVEVASPEDCWEFGGARDRWGYGVFTKRGPRGRWGVSRAHRIAWALSNSTPIGTRLVLHACDNPACCNPAHLRAGTQRDNMWEMSLKGRSPKQSVTSCKNGHPYDEANTKWRSDRGPAARECRACNRAASARRAARLKSTAASAHTGLASRANAKEAGALDEAQS